MPPSEEQQNSPEEEEQSLPTGAELLAEQIAQAKEQIRRIQVMLEHIEHRRYDTLLVPANIPLVVHGLGLLIAQEWEFIELTRRSLAGEEES